MNEHSDESSSNEETDVELGDNARHFLLEPSREHKVYDDKWYNKWYNVIMTVLGVSSLSLVIGSIAWALQKTKARCDNFEESQMCFSEIKQSMESESDIAYYFEEGIRHLTDNQTMTCIVLSRYRIFQNTTSILTHSDNFCFDEGDEFGSKEPTLIASDKYLISCFNLIDRTNDFCIFAHFDDDANGLKANQKMEMILDVNSDKNELFSGAPFSVVNLKSFAFFGDQLFGIDTQTKQHFNHWNLSHIANRTVGFNQIPLDILSSDLNLDDSVYPIRLEVHNGFLYLFQRFESAKGVEVSKISYFDKRMSETGIAWQYSKGHENLFEDFAKIHGFVFDPNMKKYFMFSDIEIILNDQEQSGEDEADFFIDSDLKFKQRGSDEWAVIVQCKNTNQHR